MGLLAGSDAVELWFPSLELSCCWCPRHGPCALSPEKPCHGDPPILLRYLEEGGHLIAGSQMCEAAAERPSVPFSQ